MAQPSERPFANETPAERLVHLLERHGLEEGLRAILDAMNAERSEEQRKARLELLEYMLEGQPPISEAEIEAARRECEG